MKLNRYKHDTHIDPYKKTADHCDLLGSKNIIFEQGINFHYRCVRKSHPHYLLKRFTKKPAKKKYLSWETDIYRQQHESHMITQKKLQEAATSWEAAMLI